MRLESLLLAAICVASAVGSEAVETDLAESRIGRGVRGSYFDGEIGTVNNDVKEEQAFWNRLLQETEMSVAPTPPPPTPRPPTTPQPVTPPTPPPVDEPTPAPIVPTVPPTTSPPVSTPAPTTRSVLDIILPVAKFGGEEFEDPDSYQSKALSWLEGNANVGSYSDEQIIQRYALASIYYSTFAVTTPATDAFLGAGVTPAGWNTTDGWLSDDDECTWFGVGCDGSNVNSISLGNNYLTGTFACEVSLMGDTLTTLDIFRNPVYNNGDADNNFLALLPELQFLMLQETNFRYPGLPPQMAALTNLVELDVSNTLYGGGALLGEIFANMPFLRYLDISKNDFSSPIPIEIGELPSLENFYAVDSGITGDLSFMEPMTMIKEMWVDLNPNLEGEIPGDIIGDKTTLESLGLSSSGFTGPLPASMGQLVNMKEMWLYNNGFTGEVPAEFGDMASLELLQLQMNDIGGSMPQAVCDLRPPGGSLDSLVADCVSEVQCAETCCTACF